MYYANQCPETGRWFVCRQGADNNLCECFDWNGTPAAEIASFIADAFNLAERHI